MLVDTSMRTDPLGVADQVGEHRQVQVRVADQVVGKNSSQLSVHNEWTVAVGNAGPGNAVPHVTGAEFELSHHRLTVSPVAVLTLENRHGDDSPGLNVHVGTHDR